MKDLIRKGNISLVCLICITLFLCSAIRPSQAQQIGDWSAVTSLNTINSITQDSEGTIWGVSNGGLFSFTEGEFTRSLTPVNGMYRLDGSAISYLEESDRLMIGYIDGMIDLYDPNENTFQRIEDIRRVQTFTARGINAIRSLNDKIYVATDFGIVVYNASTLLVADSFTKIGSFDRGTPVLDMDIQNSTIFLATQQGVASASLQSDLNLDASWVNYTEDDGLPQETIQSIAFFNGETVASTSSANLVLQNGSWQNNTRYGTQKGIQYRNDFDDELLAAFNRNRIFFTNSNNQTEQLNVEEAGISDLFYDSETTSSLFVASETSGMGRSELSSIELEFISPSGPNLNFFDGMTFDGDEFLSGTTPQSQLNSLLDNAKGYYIADESRWRNFNRLNNETLDQTQFRLAFTTAVTEEFFYIGSWGSGIARHKRESDEITVFNADNSTIRGWAADDPTFPVITGLQSDSEGAVWATSRYATRPLYVQLPGENEWINYQKSPVVSGTDEYLGLFIDSFDQKWISLQSTGQAGRGLLVLDTGDPAAINESDGVKLTDQPTNGNLPDLQVTAIIEDREGEVWVGTERGIARFIFPQFIISGSQQERRGQWLLNEDPNAESPFLLRDIQVTAMAVNSANEKWIGTAGEGIWLLNETGSAILEHFTADNSPLLSDVIRDIAIFDETGEVYISTELGLSIYHDTPSAPVQTMDDLKVFPNPFVYDRHGKIFIENLSETTTIRILGVDGTLIQKIENRGGRAEWNGRDFQGEKVGSGVYIIVALGPDGDERGTGKVAIIR
ncbi:MAG: hypothetical protein GVY08_07140 [Bacteroidetes bacterium]|nr:hypothetical protein [Bacteroidota bacterium]